MIKLVNILKEIVIGSGEQGIVHSIGKDKIIKKSHSDSGFSGEDMFFYEKFNKHPNIFPKIYQLTKKYVIMERLDPNINQGKVLDFLESIGMWVDDDPLTQIYNSVKKDNFKELNIIFSKCPKEIYDILTNWLNFCKKINNMFPQKSLDVQISNVGTDKNNNLKIFDLALDF